MMFLWWALIVLGVIALAKWMFALNITIPQNDTPFEFLKRRYARGEIPWEECQKLRHNLDK